jgi:hypothetical protein
VAATKKLATANIAKTSNNSTHHTVFGKSILEAFMLSKNKILEAFINLMEKSTYLIEDSYSTANVTEKDELKKTVSMLLLNKNCRAFAGKQNIICTFL